MLGFLNMVTDDLTDPTKCTCEKNDIKDNYSNTSLSSVTSDTDTPESSDASSDTSSFTTRYSDTSKSPNSSSDITSSISGKRRYDIWNHTAKAPNVRISKTDIAKKMANVAVPVLATGAAVLAAGAAGSLGTELAINKGIELFDIAGGTSQTGPTPGPTGPILGPRPTPGPTGPRLCPLPKPGQL